MNELAAKTLDDSAQFDGMNDFIRISTNCAGKSKNRLSRSRRCEPFETNRMKRDERESTKNVTRRSFVTVSATRWPASLTRSFDSSQHLIHSLQHDLNALHSIESAQRLEIADKSAHCWHATATGQLIQRRSGQWRSGRIGENEAKDDSNRLGSLNKWKTGNRFLGFPAKKREDCLWFDDGLGLLFGCCHVVVVVEVGSRTVQRPIIEKLPKTTSQQNRRRNHQHNCQCVPLILLGRAPQLEFRWNGHSRIRRPESSDCVNCMSQAEDSEPVSHITWLAHK